tara:strand:+ start:508 stop:690 length:183 start_codon:yes stop_codon:yes gene_type:complete
VLVGNFSTLYNPTQSFEQYKLANILMGLFGKYPVNDKAKKGRPASAKKHKYTAFMRFFTT